MTQSASRTGSCPDHTAAESLFATLKVELVAWCRYQTRHQAPTSIFAWSARYNDRRLHSTLTPLPPTEYEQSCSLAPMTVAAA